MKRWRKNGLQIKMAALVTEPTDKYNGRRRVWKLQQDFSIIVASEGMEQRVTVPAGYETDFASVPLVCQLFLGNRDDYAEIAVIHDHLCSTHVPYFICNAWLRAGLFCVGAPWHKRLAYYYAVMIFGYKSPLSATATTLWNKVWRKK